MAAIYSLYIINKSGGLIFYKDYGLQGRMDTDDSLRLASLWHSMHAISQQLSPIQGCSGIELLEADTFDLHCFQSLTLTGMFLIMMFSISKPDVFKSPNSETYVILCVGGAKFEDLSSQLQTQAAQRFKMPDMSSVMGKPDAAAATAQADEEKEEVDETGVEPRGITLGKIPKAFETKT
ncbi:putative trafficking protein particle complex subunit [Helianthus annuus]|nr:putative trafficking protein particle complex subunit [Helianthus annuus]KAJ0506797.1 putative trafficking protein particle complex subunit [Helianthus annuus]